MSNPIDREDPGLQPERTLLAWQRTLILLVVVGLLFLRGELTTGANPIPQAPPVVRMALMIAFLFVAAIVGLHLWLRWRRSREGLRDPAGTGGPPRAVSAPWAMVLLCASVLVLALVQIAAVLAG
ncbi:DUF202 domain-containing protein [Nocardiopsis changdeensis]|uniref:DUF202 domain-containing protein n=1 Tax=Nocardiopsis changdeensis TaxID=2831969 RepID=A0ABX8BLV5_9ACTN|nr:MULTISPECIES: DUF202 domain-containing protein [Nocardiopsis]QUX23066.1 DUF202 domain-containing protein [Nocardiopsis changdeensis]QYX39011.1 DUF202 domain-containing protein [Nocardiopsis sp. MT53]